jgi:predicted ATPase
MAKNTDKPKRKANKRSPAALRAISVAGYKSVGERQRVEIRPLTLLAGANSGGKSSLIQPMLLLKQTLDAPYDPGSLLLDGPNVRLTSTTQLLTKRSKSESEKNLVVGFELNDFEIELSFEKKSGHGLEIKNNIIRRHGDQDIILEPNLNSNKIKEILSHIGIGFHSEILEQGEFKLRRDRSFLSIDIIMGNEKLPFPLFSFVSSSNFGVDIFSYLRRMIHLPGLRGNPERTYKTTAVGDTFPGTFESYVASIIHYWQTTKNERLTQLGRNLETLGLTWKVSAQRLDDTQVELKVGRLSHGNRGGAHDLVSIADVGFGVSQTLPVLVALLTANAGQIVYLEQPEIHLHPRAQLALARVLAEAAKRGVLVITETHSALLLQGIQTLVAKDELSKDIVKLHWVQRDEKGMTRVTSADLDSTGAFGDWPVDFMEVGLEADNEYLTAAETKLFSQTP